ncbi:pirin family protein [Streptomyces sp. VRA16 Mangrove soil]|uniref:pirin family protein n=1 Tax=Streptomyces sp. VRA16 Mangrove soil TaxID=2817434 RepID=UPI001A9D9E5F|nr:pirin family protein [Streptomyces sp. VRA16 Mangrove soil]MBO1330299.1 pirin family protein [Streptomyces sp. VRA16 Mangrove soil]
MSNLDRQAVPSLCGGRGFVVAEPVRELLSPRRVQLGESTEVRRLLPNLGRRMIGAWAFVDQYGPDDIADEPGMQVPPHPHMGLQTVSWLHEGEVLHRDSTGSLQTIRPRELGLMTSGRAISHSEESPKSHARFLHGAQLWVALPDEHRHIDPKFEHHADLPTVTAPGLDAIVILGELDGTASPGSAYTPIVGADITLASGAEASLPLVPDFEYGVLSMSGEVHVDGVPVLPGSLLYLGCGRTELPLRAASDAEIMLLGGEPFAEELVMWWNFIGRNQDEITQAREDWMSGSRFGEVKGYDGDRLDAPELPPVPLKPRGRVR